MRVELLYWDGDPHYMAARQRLVEVLTEDAFETPIQMIAVGSRDDAELLGMRGSPSIRIDGEDIEGPAAPGVGLAPRDYAGGGRVPGKE
ncbi:MAG TPA: thioredoxin family protein, partial [Candidatus Limnocylindria bacterium]|nr:thioredoxin family protein [Candidatus Limnocylindria bacterium]